MKIELPYAESGNGADASPLISDERAILTQPYGGRWYHACKQGRAFIGSSAATGVVPPIFSNTAQVFGLWNPAGSGVNAILVNLRMTYVDTTGAAGGYCLAVNKNAGSAIATGGISVFTESTPERGLIGSGVGGNSVRFTGSAATVIAPTFYRSLGVNQLVTTATTTTATTFLAGDDFDGDVILAPNTAIYVCGNIATLSKWALSISWIEETA